MAKDKKRTTPKDIPISDIKGLYQRGDSYRYKRMVNGVMVRESLGDDLNLARAHADRLNHQINSGDDIVSGITAKKITLKKMFQENENLKNNIRQSTQKRYSAVKDNFLHWCEQNQHSKVVDIKSNVVDSYLHSRSTKPIIPNDHIKRKGVRAININGASEKTLVFEKSYLSSVFDYAVKREWIKSNPFKSSIFRIKKSKSKSSDISLRSFTKEEMLLLIEAAANINNHKSFGNCTWQEVLTFFFKTGLRENELLNLQWSDIDWAKGNYGVINLDAKEYVETLKLDDYPEAISILKQHIQNKCDDDLVFEADELEQLPIYSFPFRSHKTFLNLRCKNIKLDEKTSSIENHIFWEPKASTGYVPLSLGMNTLLKSIAKKSVTDGFVFSSHVGGRIRTQLLPILKKTVKAAKINIGKRTLTLHSTRHTFGCMLRDNNIPLETIMGLMRHSDIKETLRYAPYSLKEGSKAIQVMDL